RRHNGGMITLPPELESLVASRYAELGECCREAGIVLQDDAGVAERIRHTLLASDFAFEVWRRQPELLGGPGLERLRSSDDAAMRKRQVVLEDTDEATAMHR